MVETVLLHSLITLDAQDYRDEVANLLYYIHNEGNLDDSSYFFAFLHQKFSKDVEEEVMSLGQQAIHEAKLKQAKDNNEYYIYTLSNLSIIKLIRDKDIDLAIQCMTHALELCKSGQNWLAIKQCLNDWDEVIKIYNLNYPSSIQAFQKWHQVLQKELLPYLHHLSNLYAFLQQS